MTDSGSENSSSDSDSQFSEDGYISSDIEDYPDTISCKKAGRLRDALRDVSVRSAFDRTPHEFVPEGEVEKLIHKKSVIRGCLQSERGDKYTHLVDYIFGHARKAFAVATFAKINSHKAMKWFMKKKLGDKDLPIVNEKPDWTKSWRNDFFDAQWRFFAPVFSTSIHSHDIEKAQILPVVAMPHVAGQGAFGEVSQFLVHRAHVRPVCML
jgi:hypothetical protein